MTDRELIALAAQAAGIELFVWGTKGEENYVAKFGDERRKWNPLTDDGDALRLAVKLNITVYKGWALTPTGRMFDERKRTTPLIATRRAIVRAAAEIWKSKP